MTQHTLRMVAWALGVLGAAAILGALYLYDVRSNMGAAGLTGLLGLLLVSQAVRLQWLASRMERAGDD